MTADLPAGTAQPTGTVKCLVWDLDNTLLRGTLLEDGAVGLRDGVGQVVEELDRRGILQSVSSKNDHDLAWARLQRLGLTEYLILPHIGWGPKSDAVRQIAARLGFAHHSVAFIDDEPAERAEVAFHLPDVRCYPAEAATALVRLAEFSPTGVSQDARRRRQMYQAGFRREQAREQFAGPDEEFLRSLRMVLRIAPATGAELARVAELTTRTSQMNATGVHYSGPALQAMLGDPAHLVLVVTMADRFGPHGAVGVVLLDRYPPVWHLKLLATSCRVVSFGAGAVVLGWLLDQAARHGVHLAADFRRTDRNRIMEVAYRFAGFTEHPCDCLPAVPAIARAAGVQLLHTAPARQPAPTTMRLVAPDLAATWARPGGGTVS